MFETRFDSLDLPPVDQLVNPSQTMPVMGGHGTEPGMCVAHVPAELAEEGLEQLRLRADKLPCRWSERLTSALYFRSTGLGR